MSKAWSVCLGEQYLWGFVNMPKPIHADTSVVKEPKVSLAEKAEQFIASLRQLLAQKGLKWHAPTVSQNEEENSIEISWWRADKSLIITVEPDSPTSFLKVWGPNIHSEMDGGENPSDNQLIELWQWLYA